MFAQRLCKPGLVCHLPSICIKHCELGVVVEHLFEVRDAPFAVDCIAMKTATDMIVDTAIRDAL